MSTQKREQHLNSLLTQCEQLYQRILQAVPNPESCDPTTISEDRKRFVFPATLTLLRHLAEVDKLLNQAALDGSPQPIARGPLSFYRETLIPQRDILEDLFIKLNALPDFDIDPSSRRPRSDSDPVWNILVSGLDFWTQDPDEFTTDDLEATERLIYSPFFEPDEWLRNLEDIQPVLGVAAVNKVPGNVRVRLREVYRSFILGNHLSVIALARAILEYTLIDRASLIGIDPAGNDARYPSRMKRLAHLVDDAAEKLPHLRLQMESILDAGNQTLHPKKKDKLALLPTALRNLALSSIDAIRVVVEELYL